MSARRNPHADANHQAACKFTLFVHLPAHAFAHLRVLRSARACFQGRLAAAPSKAFVACNKNARRGARTSDLEVNGLAHASGCDTTTPCAPHPVCNPNCWVTVSGVLAGSAAQATPRGFEPRRAEPNGFRVHVLNRSNALSNVIAACMQEETRMLTPITKPRVNSL